MKRSFTVCLMVLTAFIAFSSGPMLSDRAWSGQPQEIVLHHVGDITGPYAPITGAAAAYAMPDFEAYINAQGGIKGTKLKIIVNDTRNKRDVSLAKYAEISAGKPALIVLHQSADMEVLKARLEEDKIPALGFSPTPKTIWPPGWIFQTLPPYADQFALFLDWLRSEWRPKGKIKMAFVNPDYPYGHSIFTPEVEEYLKKKGIDVVAKEFFPPFDVDATTQLTRVAAHSPDVIYSMTIASQPRVILKSAETVGLLGATLFGMGCWGMDRAAANVAGGLMEGVVGVQPYWVGTDVKTPIIKEFVDGFMAKKRPNHELTMAYSGFCTVNAIAVEALAQTVDRVGWDKLSGQEVFKTLLESKGFKCMGFQPFEFTPGTRSPLRARVVKIEKADVIPLANWMPCPDMRPVEYR